MSEEPTFDIIEDVYDYIPSEEGYKDYPDGSDVDNTYQLLDFSGRLVKTVVPPEYDGFEPDDVEDIPETDPKILELEGALSDVVSRLDDSATDAEEIFGTVADVQNNTIAIGEDLIQAKTDITTAQTTATQASIDAVQAKADAVEAHTKAMEGIADAAQAQSSAAAAAVAANTAHTTATGAIAEAQAALTAANSAAGSASAAQTTADSAAASAASAAGIASGKADVLIQGATPPVPMQKDTTLWIDTTGGLNTPKRWNGTAWVAVTDKAAVDAASAAASAQSTANAAVSSAQSAMNAAIASQEQADTATTLANAAQTLANTANSTAGTAQADATAALSNAASAASAASAAQTSASAAQSKADQATADAASAAGIANGKADVLMQSAAPAVAMRKASTLWIDTTGGNNTPKRWSGSAWVAVTDKAAVDAANAAAAAQTTANQAVADAVLAKNAADSAAAAALGAQSTADAANARATTADGRITIALADPTVADATGKPIGAIWEVRSGSTVLRRFVLTAASTWTLVKIGTDFIGAGAIGTAQIADAAIGTAHIGDAAITNAKIGDLSVDKLRVTGGAEFPTAVVDTLVSQQAFIDDLVSQKVIIQGKDNKVGTILLEDGAVTAPKILAGAVTTEKLTAGAVTADKVAATAIDGKTINGADIYSPSKLSLPRAHMGGSQIEIVRSDGEGGEVSTIKLGGSTSDQLALYGANGELISGLMSDGSGRVGGELSVDSLLVDGQSIGSIIDPAPLGILSMKLSSSDSKRAGTAVVGYVTLTTRMRTDRLYRVKISGMMAAETAGDTAQVYIQASDPTTKVLQIGNYPINKTTAEYITLEAITPGLLDGLVRITILWKNATANRGLFWSGRDTYPVTTYVEDIGLRNYNNDGNSAEFSTLGSPLSGGTNTDVTGDTPYTKIYTASWTRSWRGSGIVTDNLHQGYWGGYQRYSMAGFPAEMSTDLSGATIKKVEVYLANQSWWGPSGTAIIGRSTATSAPSSPQTSGGSAFTSTGWSAGAAKWVTAPAGWWTASHRAITLGEGAGTGTTTYGKFANSPVRMRITYTK